MRVGATPTVDIRVVQLIQVSVKGTSRVSGILYLFGGSPHVNFTVIVFRI